MYIHFARIGGPLDAPVDRLEYLASLDRWGKHWVVADPKDADVILFSQGHMIHSDWRLAVVASHANSYADPDRVMVFDERDRPWCRLPGVYVSMPARHFDRRYQRAWGYFPRTLPAPPIEAPDLLFSFVGSMTHKCRLPLLGLEGEDAVVEPVSGYTFYDRSSPDFEAHKKRFGNVLGRSRFVLCPRGQGTSSIRLYEALSIGRVPVVISDEWVPPPGPDWSRFSLRWPEGSVAGLRDVLQTYDEQWPEMSNAAREAYEEFFAPNVWFHQFAELLQEVRHETRPEFPRRGIRRGAFWTSAAHAWLGRAHEWRGRMRRGLRNFRWTRFRALAGSSMTRLRPSLGKWSSPTEAPSGVPGSATAHAVAGRPFRNLWPLRSRLDARKHSASTTCASNLS